MDVSALVYRIKEFVAQVHERAQVFSIAERDRKILLMGLCMLFIILLSLVFHSFSSGAEQLERQARQLEARLGNVEALSVAYRGFQERFKELSSKVEKDEGPLISVVEKILLSGQIDRRRFSIRDVNSPALESDDFFEEQSVDVELKKIPLNDLVGVLYKIQTKSSFLKVSNLSISTRFDKSDAMNVRLRVSTYRIKQVS